MMAYERMNPGVLGLVSEMFTAVGVVPVVFWHRGSWCCCSVFCAVSWYFECAEI